MAPDTSSAPPRPPSSQMKHTALLKASQQRRSVATALLRDLLPIFEESLQTNVRERVLCHLLEDLERHRHDVRADLRGVNHMQRMAYRRDEDLTVPFVVPEDRNNLANHLHSILANVVEATDERAHVLRPRLRGEDCLVRAEDQRRIDLDALCGECLDRLEPLRRHLHFHDDVLM